MAFNLDIPEIESTPQKRYEFDVTAAWIAESLADTELSAPNETAPDVVLGHVVVSATKTGPDLLLQASVSVKLQADCVRCTDPVEFTFDKDFTRLLSPASSVSHKSDAEEVELSAADLDVDHFEGDVVDFAPFLREHLLLESPSRPVCVNGCSDPVVVAILDRGEAPPAPAPASPFAGLAGLKVEPKKDK